MWLAAGGAPNIFILHYLTPICIISYLSSTVKDFVMVSIDTNVKLVSIYNKVNLGYLASSIVLANIVARVSVCRRCYS